MRTLLTRRAQRAALIALSVGVAACDFPSEPPIFQQTWVVPSDSVQVGVAELLPAGVAVTGGGTAFAVTTQTANFQATLGALCGQPECQSPGTVNAPVPAFTSAGASLTSAVSFPASVASAQVANGAILTLAITNNLGFDPLRPNGVGNAPFGSIAVTVTSGAAINATTTFTGATQGIPAGLQTNLQVPLPAGAYSGAVNISIAFTVPAGGNANLAASNSITVGASVSNLTVTGASVTVTNEAISAAPTQLDLDELDFADEVQSGAIELEVTNPLAVTAVAQLTVSAPAQNGQPLVSIVKNINLPALANGTVSTVSFTQNELRQLIGKANVTIALTGTANSSTGQPVAVTPAARIVLKTRMQLVLNIGG